MQKIHGVFFTNLSQPGHEKFLGVLIFVSMDEKDRGIAFAKRAKAKLKANADDGRAPGMERYMRDQFPFFGIPAPIRSGRSC